MMPRASTTTSGCMPLPGTRTSTTEPSRGGLTDALGWHSNKTVVARASKAVLILPIIPIMCVRRSTYTSRAEIAERMTMPRILDRMLRRMLPLLVVLAVAGAPVATEVCQITCTSPSQQAGTSHSAMPHATHASGKPCHDASGASGPRMAPMPHVCGHDTERQPPALSISNAVTQTWTVAIPLTVVSVSPAAHGGLSSLVLSWSPLPSLTRPTAVRSVMPLRV
jgi:hypothetical protein